MNAVLSRAVAAEGLFYPPDPSSWELSTIGGNLATNADRPVRRGRFGGIARAIELPATCELPVPDPPGDREHWTDDQLRRWLTIWKGPAATLYDDSQVGAVALLVDLEASHAKGDLRAAGLTEYRRLLADLLLTPAALAGAGFRLPGWPT